MSENIDRKFGWHLTENELPPENVFVLGYFPCKPWVADDDPHYKVVSLTKGLSLKERENLSDEDERKRSWYFEDEGSGNNERPYCWEEFGPDNFFGQECVAWSYFPHYEGFKGTRADNFDKLLTLLGGTKEVN